MLETYNGRWANFPDDELRCKHTGLLNPHSKFIKLMDIVQQLRDKLGVPLPLSSAYRHATHPIEINKEKPGQHTIAAVDISCYGELAFKVVELALKLGIRGLGVNQKGKLGDRFIHLDLRDDFYIWSYS